MAIKILKQKRQKGYAILFAIIIISAISVVTAGLLSVSYKQMILSSLANDSQIAFYQADKGAECALYLDRFSNNLDDNNFTEWECGGVSLYITNRDGKEYDIEPTELSNSSDPCFRIKVEKHGLDTVIRSDGFNICDHQNNIRAIQRSIEIGYTDEL
jgi:uncharacterized protein (UPF0333 family)